MTTQRAYGQALAFICTTDTFTRSVAAGSGLGSGYTWQSWDSAFPDQASSTTYVDGSRVVLPAGGYDSYSIDNPVPESGTVLFDFYVPFNVDTNYAGSPWGEPTYGVKFGTSYSSDGAELYVGPSDTEGFWLIGSLDNDLDQDQQAYTFAIEEDTMYRAKMAYTADGAVGYKVWKVGDSEPSDWALTGQVFDFPLDTAWIDFYYGGFTNDVYFDNLTFCTPESIAISRQTYGQAGAQIVNTTPNAQAEALIWDRKPHANAQALTAWDTISLPFVDNFGRTTVRNLGYPWSWELQSSSYSHPAESLTYVDGLEAVFPQGHSDTYNLKFAAWASGGYGKLSFNIQNLSPSGGFTINNLIQASQNGANKVQVSLVAVGNNQDIYALLFENGNLVQLLQWNGLTYSDIQITLIWTTSGYTFDAVDNFSQTTLDSQPGSTVLDATGATNFQLNMNTTGMIGGNVYYDKFTLADSQQPRGFGQAAALIYQDKRWAQAQGKIKAFGVKGYGQSRAYIETGKRGFGQARAKIKIQRWVWAQAQGFIRPRVGHANAQAKIKMESVQKYGQANAYVVRSMRFGQAQGRIKQTYNVYAQAQARIGAHYSSGQAQARIDTMLGAAYGQAVTKILNSDILVGTRTRITGQALTRIKAPVGEFGQAQAQINGPAQRYGQVQAFIKRTIEHGLAQAWIYRDTPGNLVRYNGYIIPGYLQSEVLISEESINTTYIEKYDFSTFSEYMGLKNKLINIKMLVADSTYGAAKNQVNKAGTMLRSNRSDFVRLILKRPDRYYMALTKEISMDQTTGAAEKNALYEVTFEAKPWRYGDWHTLTGTIDTNNVGRTMANGTWTPALVTLTGTDITVSGYAGEEFTGFISVSGAVTNLVIDSDAYSATMDGQSRDDLMNSLDYRIYIAPGRTQFATTGVDSITVEYDDRWPL